MPFALLFENDAVVKLFGRRMRVWFADEEEMSGVPQRRLADRLTRAQILAEVDRAKPAILVPMRGQPASDGAAFAVLFVVPILWDNELRLRRNGPIVAKCHDRGGQHGVEILGSALAALAVGAVRTVDFVEQ